VIYALIVIVVSGSLSGLHQGKLTAVLALGKTHRVVTYIVLVDGFVDALGAFGVYFGET
jgi:hypothetical protein